MFVEHGDYERLVRLTGASNTGFCATLVGICACGTMTALPAWRSLAMNPIQPSTVALRLVKRTHDFHRGPLTVDFDTLFRMAQLSCELRRRDRSR